MEKKNIFEVGTEVSGESMIGYRYHLEYLVNAIMNTNGNISITGLKRSGKTSLVKEAIRIIEKKSDEYIFIKTDLAKYKCIEDFLRKIVGSLKIITRKHNKIVTNVEIKELFSELDELDPDDFMYREIIQEIFLNICAEGIKVVLYIDEFDEATKLFKETSDFEMLRDWASNGDLRFSLLLVSRRQIYMIEKRNFNNSTFHGVITTYPINGFNEEDIREYCMVLENYGINLSSQKIEKIRYYAGKSPYLWSTFGYELVENMQKEMCIDDIFNTHLLDIRDHFDAIYHNLSNDQIRINEELIEVNSIDKLSAIIFGPKIGITLEDITILKSLGYLDIYNGNYYSVSNYFTRYLYTKYSPSKNSLFEAIIKVEKALKGLLNREIIGLAQKYNAIGKKINCIQKKILFGVSEIGEGNIVKYENFIRDNMCFFEKKSTYFDVISLRDTIKIIAASWDELFDKYFNNDSYETWREILEKCGRVRNPVAHGHEDFLTDEEKQLVDVYCKKINDQLCSEKISKIVGEEISEETLIKYVMENLMNCHESENTEDEVFVFVGEKTTSRKNLQGHLSNGEVGSISSSYFFKDDFEAEEFIGREIKVRIKESNPQKSGYILEPVKELCVLF